MSNAYKSPKDFKPIHFTPTEKSTFEQLKVKSFNTSVMQLL